MADRTTPYFTYITFVMDHLGVSATELAKLAGISSSTITRFLFNEKYKFTPSTTTINKIAKASGVSPAPFLASDGFASSSLAPFVSEDLYDRTGEGESEHGPTSGLIIIIGYADATFARAASLSRIEDFAPLSVNIAGIEPERCFGVIVQGGNIDKIAADGEILVCVSCGPTTRLSHDKSVVVIERALTEDRRFIEISARIARQCGTGWRFEHASTNPQFQDVLEAPDLASAPSCGFRVMGIASFIFRNLP